ncbi:hypothetical protein PR048_000614 [Dryococelus australis]|uniref:Uncharacterized protein n=1 Tax=Dryococelus australis TaxID=614101 RepID=A0ABQ9IF53_9NEOP|nr:hypothetical protein PR048_000614 [Dryococelus australis]
MGLRRNERAVEGIEPCRRRVVHPLHHRGCYAVRLPTSHQGEPGSIPGRITPTFSQVGIVPADTARRRIISGISRFPRPCKTALLHYRLISPLSALKSSILLSKRARPSVKKGSSCNLRRKKKAKGTEQVPVNTRHTVVRDKAAVPFREKENKQITDAVPVRREPTSQRACGMGCSATGLLRPHYMVSQATELVRPHYMVSLPTGLLRSHYMVSLPTELLQPHYMVYLTTGLLQPHYLVYLSIGLLQPHDRVLYPLG